MNGNQIAELRGQIGWSNMLAISGGRTMIQDGKLVLHVSSGYRVIITLDEGRDLYDVERVFVRGDKTFRKGKIEGIYADQVGECAYDASCYKNVEFPGAW